ncbi:hypothetical protein NKDENANG_03979 [Candidatus Entotheonellaceae bacterium PAL068K]
MRHTTQVRVGMHLLAYLWLTVTVSLLGACATLGGNQDTQSAYEAGLALFNQGRSQEAIPRFTQATQLDPKFGQAYLYLGRSYLNLGLWLKAVPPLRTASRQVPDEMRREALQFFINALFGTATAELKRGNLSSAAGLLEEILNHQPRSRRATEQLVPVLLALGSDLLTRGKRCHRYLPGSGPARPDQPRGLSQSGPRPVPTRRPGASHGNDQRGTWHQSHQP